MELELANGKGNRSSSWSRELGLTAAKMISKLSCVSFRLGIVSSLSLSHSHTLSACLSLSVLISCCAPFARLWLFLQLLPLWLLALVLSHVLALSLRRQHLLFSISGLARCFSPARNQLSSGVQFTDWNSLCFDVAGQLSFSSVQFLHFCCCQLFFLIFYLLFFCGFFSDFLLVKSLAVFIYLFYFLPHIWFCLIILCLNVVACQGVMLELC